LIERCCRGASEPGQVSRGAGRGLRHRFVGTQILTCLWCHVGLSWCVGIHPVAHTSFFTTRGAVVWAFSNSSTHQFSRTQRGLVCGRLSLRPHARLLAHTQSWQLPCVSAGYMATALALLVSRWQLSFTRVAMCFLHGTWQLP